MDNKMKKKYKVTALVDYYLYAEIEADSKEEATEIYEKHHIYNNVSVQLLNILCRNTFANLCGRCPCGAIEIIDTASDYKSECMLAV